MRSKTDVFYNGKWMPGLRASAYSGIDARRISGRKGKATQIHGKDSTKWEQGVWDNIFRKGDGETVSPDENLIIKMASLEAGMNKISTRLDTFDPHKVEKYLDTIEGRVKIVNDRLIASIHKETVSTEMLYLLRNRDPEKIPVLLPELISLYDRDDKFWIKHGQKSLGWWKKYLLAESNKVVPIRGRG